MYKLIDYKKKLTDYLKLECAEYVLDLLGKKLKASEFDMAAGEWILRCKNECIMRRGQYLDNRREDNE